MKITDSSINCCAYKENCTFFLKSEIRFTEDGFSKKVCLFTDERNNRIIIINEMHNSDSFPSITETIESIDEFAIKYIEDSMYLAHGITIVLFETDYNKAQYVILHDDVCNTLKIEMAYFGMINIEKYIGESKSGSPNLSKHIQYTEITNGIRNAIIFD